METNCLVPILTLICCVAILAMSVSNFIKMLNARKNNRKPCGKFEIYFAFLCALAGIVGIIFSAIRIGKCDDYNKEVSGIEIGNDNGGPYEEMTFNVDDIDYQTFEKGN